MEASALRNFKDFLQLYNKMTENCFARCVDNVNSRSLDENEIKCVDDCSSKFILYNNKLMSNFVNVQTDIVNKRVKDAEELQQQQQQIDDNKTETEIQQQEIIATS